MRYTFDPRHGLRELRLYEEKSKLSAEIGPEATKAFPGVLGVLRSAPTELQIRQMESLHYEILENRKPERSVRITPRRWRLIFWVAEDPLGKFLWLKCIENYHDDRKGKKKRGQGVIQTKFDHIVDTDENLIPPNGGLAVPGSILKAEIDTRGLSQADLARVIGRPVQVVSEIITGIKQITPETALQIGAALGTGPELWLNLEANYRLDLARQRGVDEDIPKRARMYRIAPIAQLIKRGWISAGDALEASLCSFLHIATIWEEPTGPASLRVSMDRGPEMYSVTAWLRRVEDLAATRPVGSFNAGALRTALPEIAAMSVDPASVAAIPDRLAALGVALVFVPHLTRTYLDGGTIWIDDRPVVAMTLRYDRIDYFYFTLMHELAHVVLGHRDAMAEKIDGDESGGKHESAANALAQKALVGARDQSRIVGMVSGIGFEQLPDIAASMSRHPGILVGQLHHEGLSYQRGRGHLVKVNAFLAPQVDQPAA